MDISSDKSPLRTVRDIRGHIGLVFGTLGSYSWLEQNSAYLEVLKVLWIVHIWSLKSTHIFIAGDLKQPVFPDVIMEAWLFFI